MVIFIRIEIPNSIARPGIPIANILREVIPVVETAIPLQNGRFAHRLTNETLAEWTVVPA